MVPDGPPLPRKSRSRLWMVGLLLPVMLVVGLFYGLDAWVNAQWRAAVADYEKEGETLNYLDLLPPPLPEAENFAAIEALRDLPVVEDGDEGKGDPAAKRAALLKMREDIPLEAMRYLGSRVLNAKPDWAIIASDLSYRSSRKVAPSAGKEASYVRQTLEELHPLLVELPRRATHFSQSQWVPPMRERYAGEPLISVRRPHIKAVSALQFALHLHGAACVAMGDSAAALADIRLLLLLERSFEDEARLLPYTEGMTADAAAFNLLRLILTEAPGTLNDAELAGLQQLLESVNVKERLLQGVRSEVIVGVEVIDYLINHDRSSPKPEYVARTIQRGEKEISAFPNIILTINKIRLLDLERQHVVTPLKKAGLSAMLYHERHLVAFFKDSLMGHFKFDRIISSNFMFDRYHKFREEAFLGTQRSQAILACALERYRLQHGRYPPDLEALVPTFLTQVPLDPMDDRPLRYRLEPEGHFHLWGVGLDWVDDGGQIKTSYANPLYPDARLSSSYLGDWLWLPHANDGKIRPKLRVPGGLPPLIE